ncbi:MAG: SAM-dependent methyltransferase [Gemmatimonadales bacterium]
MTSRPPRSLRYEYQLYVDREIEAYKESVSREHLCGIADSAQATLEGELQLGLRDVLLAAEVDRLIAKRLKIPSFETWRRRRLKNASEPRRPEYWGLRPDTPLAHAITSSSPTARVVVSGARVQGSALYLAANGCQVTAIEPEREVVERVLSAAEDAGLKSRVRGLATELSHWSPDGPLAAVICTPAAFAGLSELERRKVIAVLQRATDDGGVHLVETIVAGQEAISEDELKERYSEWDVSFVQEPGAAKTFVARKHIM